LQTDDALPNAELVELKSDREYLDGASQDVDALLIGSESGSALTLLCPDFEVVVPDGPRVALIIQR